jgi:hypothetical protein
VIPVHPVDQHQFEAFVGKGPRDPGVGTLVAGRVGIVVRMALVVHMGHPVIDKRSGHLRMSPSSCSTLIKCTQCRASHSADRPDPNSVPTSASRTIESTSLMASGGEPRDIPMRPLVQRLTEPVADVATRPVPGGTPAYLTRDRYGPQSSCHPASIFGHDEHPPRVPKICRELLAPRLAPHIGHVREIHL